MPSIVHGLVGKTDVRGGLHEFSAPETGSRGESARQRRYDPEVDTNVQSQGDDGDHRQVMDDRVDGWWWKRMEHSRQGGGNIDCFHL